MPCEINMGNNGVITLLREINNTNRQIDDIEWEGGHTSSLQNHLDRLLQMEIGGEYYYTLF